MDWSKFNDDVKEAVAVGRQEATRERPYDNLYKSREQLEKIRDDLAKINDGSDARVLMEIGRLSYLIGINFYDTDEFGSADKQLVNAINLLAKNEEQSTDLQENEEEGIKTDSAQPVDINYVQYLADSYNYLGMLWTGRNDPKRAEKHLKKAEKIYEIYQVNQKDESSVKLTDEKSVQRMEDLHTLTTFYLAQVYGFLKLPVNAAKYCFLTLVRQLESQLELNKLDWATNCLQLAAFFLTEDYGECEHFLKAAEYTLEQIRSTEQDREQFQAAIANLNIAKSKMALDQLTVSREFLTAHMAQTRDEFDTVLEKLSLEDIPQQKLEPKTSLNFVFPSELLPIDPPRTFFAVRNFEEALPVFKEGKHGAEAALTYYILDGYVTEHIANLETLSHLYKLIAFFEPDIPRKCAIQKKRDELLGGLINQLNVEIYLPTLKQLTFELGEMYSDVWDLMYKKAKQDIEAKRKGTSIDKINETALYSIKYLTRFTSFFEDPKTKELKVEEENVPAYIRSRLMLARLYYHMTFKDPQIVIRYLGASLKEYEFLVNFADKQDKKNLVGVEQEVEMAKQMVKLLPVKIKEEMMFARR